MIDAANTFNVQIQIVTQVGGIQMIFANFANPCVILYCLMCDTVMPVT